MKSTHAFVITADGPGAVKEHSELFFFDLPGTTRFDAKSDLIRNKLPAEAVKEWDEDCLLTEKAHGWFQSPVFDEAIDYRALNYRARWQQRGPLAGVLTLDCGGQLHSVTLLLGEQLVSLANAPETVVAILEFQMAPSTESSDDDKFPRSECFRLIELTRCPLVVSRYFVEIFDIAASSWRLLRMLSYAFFKTSGVVS